MYNITLIGTYHADSGNCNYFELLKIIEKINPEVIFEETPPSYFDKYYINKTENKLETNAINKYLESHQIEHILVDSDDVPPISFFRNDQSMHERIEKFSCGYRNIIDIIKIYRELYGFKFLNSIDYINLNKAFDIEIENTLQVFNDERLHKIRKLWNDLMNKRENEMLKNIYNYSKEHTYNTGLFLIGAAHRESIINKLKEYDNMNYVKIIWNYSNYDNIL